VFINTEPDKQSYFLPPEIDEVIDIRRSRTGIVLGRDFEPFTAAFVATVFNNTGNSLGMSSATNLVVYEAVSQFQEQVGRMFGEFVPHVFISGDSELKLFRVNRTQEIMALEVSARKTRKELFRDAMAYRWLQKATEAELKIMLGSGYAKFSQNAGAQGGVALNASMYQSGIDLQKECMEELRDLLDGGEPALPFIG
jgi:hypothetical protein